MNGVVRCAWCHVLIRPPFSRHLLFLALQMGDAEYTQSTALLRYAGKLGGLYPECPLAALKVCVVVMFGV